MTMAPSVADIIDLIETIAPTHRAEPWDNCGLQVGDPDAPVTKIAVALDADLDTIRTAAQNGADLLVTHHPLIFPDISSIDTRSGTGKAIAAALAARLSVFSAHTSLDHALEGTSFAMAKRLSLIDPTPLPHPGPIGHPATTLPGGGQSDGIVYFGTLPSKMRLGDLARFVKDALGAPVIRCVGDPQVPLARAAVCAGSGGDFVTAARSLGADVLITGEVRYHAAVSAADSGIALIEAGHFWSELPVIFETARRITEHARANEWSVDVMSIKGRDPFSYG